MKNVSILLLLASLGLAACAATGAQTSVEEPQESVIADSLAAAAAELDAIAAIPDAERTFENTVGAYDGVVAQFWMSCRMQSFMATVSTVEAERDLGRRVSAEVSAWFSRLNQREDLFLAMQAVEAMDLPLDEAQAMLLKTSLRDFRRAGMELGMQERERLLEIDDELTELGIEFSKNIADDATCLYLLEEELAGCDPDFLATLKRSGDLYVVDLKGPSRQQVFTYCSVPATRQKMSVALGRRAPANVGVLDEILALRSERAHLLGYANTADYETEVRMAKNAATVMNFYDELRPKLRKKALLDLEEYRGAKREHTGDPEAELYPWDTSFYKDWLLRERYAVDSKEVVQYFPMEAVMDGLFSISQTLYGVTYREITEEAKAAGRPFWHEDVQLFAVTDNATGDLLGEFYLDLHPRDNKYSHAAQFPLALRKRWPDGSLTRPLVALVCNFTKPTADKPSLLSHGEVETFFHEFGHCLHSIFTQVDYANLSGTSVARDFVEAPSQMFEGWVWDADVLATFTRHYETGEPLPADLLDRMVAAKNLGSGMSMEGQVYLGMMDMAFHMDEDGVLDTTATRRDIYNDTRLFTSLDNTFSQASFGHLIGYQAGYYGYLWSLVYASDMFSRFEEEGLMNTELGRAYRDEVLSRGGTREELQLVRNFLGREPNSDAFLRDLGLTE